MTLEMGQFNVEVDYQNKSVIVRRPQRLALMILRDYGECMSVQSSTCLPVNPDGFDEARQLVAAYHAAMNMAEKIKNGEGIDEH